MSDASGHAHQEGMGAHKHAHTVVSSALAQLHELQSSGSVLRPSADDASNVPSQRRSLLQSSSTGAGCVQAAAALTQAIMLLNATLSNSPSYLNTSITLGSQTGTLSTFLGPLVAIQSSGGGSGSGSGSMVSCLSGPVSPEHQAVALTLAALQIVGGDIDLLNQGMEEAVSEANTANNVMDKTDDRLGEQVRNGWRFGLWGWMTLGS